jgi:hypothetical protein
MTTSISRGSAQIYEFPPRGRFALNGGDEAKTPTKTTNLESAQAVKAVAGSGWYHDAAIQEAERTRTN